MGASVSVLRAQMPGLDDNQERTMAVLLFVETAEKVAALGDRFRPARSIAFSLEISVFSGRCRDAWGGGSAAGLLRRGVVL
jgi:hypothetical protein